MPLTTPAFLPWPPHATAKPLAAFPVALLAALLLWRAIKFKVQGSKLKVEAADGRGIASKSWWANLSIWLLAAFTAYALVIGLALAFSPVGLSFKGMSPLLAYGRAAATLVLGVLFYVVFRAMNRDGEALRRTEWWLGIGLCVSVALAVLQYLAGTVWPALLPISNTITQALVSQFKVWYVRGTGLALEPSFLASQLSVLLIPLSLARVLSGEHLRRVGIGRCRLPMDAIFLFAGVVGVTVAASRGGMVAMDLAIVAGVAVVLWHRRDPRTLRAAAIVVILMVFSNGFLMGRSIYVRDFWQSVATAAVKTESMQTMATGGHFNPRFAAWEAAWRVSEKHPVVGVGLGGSQPYLTADLPEWSLSSPEVQAWRDLNPAHRMNAYHMVMRLLSETGVIGTLLFLVFAASHLWPGRGRRATLHYRILRAAIAAALLMDFFSFCTFALPNLWFALAALYVAGRAGERLPEAAGDHDARDAPVTAAATPTME